MGLLKTFFGSQASNKQPRYASLFQGRTLTGMVSNRAVFHDPSDVTTERFYGGRPDAIYNGVNVELSDDLTIIRAYGTSPFSTVTYPTPPLRAFSFQPGDGTTQILVDTQGAIYLDNQNGSKTLIFTKASNAGQSYFLGVGNTCYIGDGAETIKYTPWNTNGIVWNWGIDAPSTAPTVTPVPAGTVVSNWAAGTVFSTMGLIVDPNLQIQQLMSVNNTGQNATPYGSSASGAPAFNTTINATTVDNQITWTCISQITVWVANQVYLPNHVIYDPGTNCLYITANGNANMTSGTTYPTFLNHPILTTRVKDGTGFWQPLGTVQTIGGSGLGLYGFTPTPTATTVWAHNTRFNFFARPSIGLYPQYVQSSICYPNKPWIDLTTGLLNSGIPIYLLAATSLPGLTANSTFTPWNGIPAQNPGDITHDGDLQWICQGPKGWLANQAYTQWTSGVETFSVVLDTNLNLQVCLNSGTSGAIAPTWLTGYGTQTTDGTVTWTCVGNAITWSAGTQWYLPVPPIGFMPPSQSQPFGGSIVIGSGYDQVVVNADLIGTSGGTTPAWSVYIGGTTTDHDITWQNIGLHSTFSLSWNLGYAYAYSYKCRTPTDYYVTNIPPGLVLPNGPYAGGGTGAISTASPTTSITGANPGAVNTVTGVGSIDPQVDTIVIWRSADGGGTSNMFELTEFPAPNVKRGSPQPIGPARPRPVPANASGTALRSFINAAGSSWTFYDYLPDVPTISGANNFPGLNNLVPAPIDDENDRPLTNFLPTAWHFQRIWGASGTSVLFSGGPDVISGNPNEAFNPADEFPFLYNVTTCIHTPAGLIVVLPTDIQAIYGGPATGSFYSTTLFPGKGCASFNCIDFIGGEIYMLSSDSQCLVITPALQMSRIGFPIADKVVNFNPTSSYLTVHDYKQDTAVYLSDGETGYFRLNPHQAPQGDAIWSPMRVLVDSCSMVQSVITSTTTRALLIGSGNNNQPILMRDNTVFTDNGSLYPAWVDIGAITLCDPGQVAFLKFVELDFAGVGTIPLVSIALDDPTPVPNWVLLTNTAYDPAQAYGNTVTPPYFPVRYYLNDTLAKCRRIRIKIDYGTGTTSVFDQQLRTAANYSLLAGSGITNSGSTVIIGGNVGSSPTPTIVPGAWVIGAPSTIDNAGAAQAQIDATNAVTYFNSLTPTQTGLANLSTNNGGGGAGVYTAPGGLGVFTGGALDIPTSITLSGSATDKFVFISASTTVLESTANVILSGGVLPQNVVWIVGSSFTQVAPGTMQGTVISAISSTLGGGSLNGRIISQTGAITIAAAEAITVNLTGTAVKNELFSFAIFGKIETEV